MHLKILVLTTAQSIKETWLDLSWASFSVGQPTGRWESPRRHPPHKANSIPVSVRAPPPRQILVSTSSLWEQGHYSLWQEVSGGPGGLLSVSIGVVYYTH